MGFTIAVVSKAPPPAIAAGVNYWETVQREVKPDGFHLYRLAADPIVRPAPYVKYLPNSARPQFSGERIIIAHCRDNAEGMQACQFGTEEDPTNDPWVEIGIIFMDDSCDARVYTYCGNCGYMESRAWGFHYLPIFWWPYGNPVELWWEPDDSSLTTGTYYYAFNKVTVRSERGANGTGLPPGNMIESGGETTNLKHDMGVGWLSLNQFALRPNSGGAPTWFLWNGPKRIDNNGDRYQHAAWGPSELMNWTDWHVDYTTRTPTPFPTSVVTCIPVPTQTPNP